MGSFESQKVSAGTVRRHFQQHGLSAFNGVVKDGSGRRNVVTSCFPTNPSSVCSTMTAVFGAIVGEVTLPFDIVIHAHRLQEHNNMAQPTGYSLRSGTKKALKEELGIVDGGKSDSKGQTETDSSKENLLKDEKPDIAPGSSQVEPNVAALVTVLNNQQQLLNKLVELHLATGEERMAKMEVERFNGKNVDPLIWIQNYEIICQNNG
ncbi:hypothetical protein LAZ67_19002305 [Cordylochernes scorpioides]|uniref:Uncharacterized protein n=1 Tax=Cordylochernes scorpioides TaxID=51811 RepID=A0ABY6LIF9_9ARAC|nr:hypothetical protein LAZ67_19002305 [Cordylochernes scorpioides]